MRKRPMFYLAWVCALGGLFAIDRSVLYPVIALGFVAYYTYPCKKKIGRSMISIVMFLLFFLHTTYVRNQLWKGESYLEEGRSAVIRGKVERIEKKGDRYALYLSDVWNHEGKIGCLIVYMDEKNISVGESILLEGIVKNFRSAGNEGEFDARRYYNSLGIVSSLEKVELLGKDGRCHKGKEFLFSLKERFASCIEENVNSKQAPVLRAILLGDKSDIDTDIKNLYKNAGISHVLSISGLHISLLALYLFRILKRIRIPVVCNAAITLVLLYCYSYMVGNGVSVRRAGGMFIILVLGRVFLRAEDSLNSLGLVVIFLLWDNPLLLQNTGFSLSVWAMFGVCITGKTAVDYIRFLLGGDLKKKRKRIFFKLFSKLSMAAAIYLTTLPFVAHYYYEIPVYGIVMNILLLPFASIIVAFGMLGLLFSVPSWNLTGFLTGILFKVVEGVLEGYRYLCEGLCRVPSNVFLTGDIPEERLLWYGILLMGSISLLRYGERKKKQVFFLCVPLWIGMALLILSPIQKENYIKVLDVGQGNCVCIQSGEKACLYDGGSADVWHVGERRILPFLKANRIRGIEYFFLSHLDSDHCNGLYELIELGYPPEYVVIAAEAEKEEKYEAFVERMKKANIPILYFRAGATMEWRSYSIHCLWPYDSCEDINDSSLVLHVRSEDGIRMLLSGDISSNIERRIQKKLKEYQSDYILAVHHGSNGSNSTEYLEQSGAKNVVVSCGKENSYGHPGKEAVRRMYSCHMNIYYTMEQGQITIGKKKGICYNNCYESN